MNRLLIVIGAATIVFSVVVSVFVLWSLDRAEESTRDASGQLAAAIERGDADAAPEGAERYVEGIRAHFGPVTRVTVIDARNKSINTGDNADTRSFFIADLLLETERGLAVVEVEFDNHSFANHSQHVSAVYELAPEDVPDDALEPATRKALAMAFADRGGRAADVITLSQGPVELPEPSATAAEPRSAAADRELSRAMDGVRCIREAAGGVAAMQECAQR
jgi:hypothetical protein